MQTNRWSRGRFVLGCDVIDRDRSEANQYSARKETIVRPFFSEASAAESFRSRWGSVRGAPLFNSHTSPIAAPHVLQGTANTCFAVRSLVFTDFMMPQLLRWKLFTIAHFIPKIGPEPFANPIGSTPLPA